MEISSAVPGEDAEPTGRPGDATGQGPATARSGPIRHAIFRVARLHRMLARPPPRRVGLHPGQELVMMQLWELGPQRQTDLVRLLDSDAATMTRTIQRLERAGFVRRHPSTTDRRAVIIEPTAASHALRRQVEQIWAQLEGLAVAGLTSGEREESLRTLERLEARLSAAAASPPKGSAAGQ